MNNTPLTYEDYLQRLENYKARKSASTKRAASEPVPDITDPNKDGVVLAKKETSATPDKIGLPASKTNYEEPTKLTERPGTGPTGEVPVPSTQDGNAKEDSFKDFTGKIANMLTQAENLLNSVEADNSSNSNSSNSNTIDANNFDIQDDDYVKLANHIVSNEELLKEAAYKLNAVHGAKIAKSLLSDNIKSASQGKPNVLAAKALIEQLGEIEYALEKRAAEMLAAELPEEAPAVAEEAPAVEEGEAVGDEESEIIALIEELLASGQITEEQLLEIIQMLEEGGV